MSDVPPPPARSEPPSGLPHEPALKRSSGLGWRIFVCLLILFVLLVSTFLWIHHRAQVQMAAADPGGRGGRGGRMGNGPTTISTAVAQQGDIGIYVNALGNVIPINTVSVNSRVEGQIM